MQKELSSYAKGVMGETAAREYLLSRGMEMLCRRYRFGSGEIDLIMREGDKLVFVEVKAREKAGPETASLSVTPAKRKRLTEAACGYLWEHPEFAGMPLRFDVILLTGEGIRHYPNAFEAENL